MPRQMVKHLSMSVQMFLEEISIRISRLSTEDVFTHAVGISQSFKGPNRTKRWRKGDCILCLSWDVHRLLPLDISTSGFRAFELRLGLLSSVPPVLGS